MTWTIDAVSVLAAGVFFAGIVIAGLTPFASLTPASFVAFGAASVVFIGAAFGLARVQEADSVPLMWVVPILPLLVIGVLLKDAVTARRASGQPERVTAIARPGDEWPLAAPGSASAVHLQQSRDGEGSPRELVGSLDVTPNQLAHFAINYPELRAVIARNPLTPDSVIEWLGQQGDPEVIAAIQSRHPAAA